MKERMRLTSITLRVTGANAQALVAGPLTSGMVGIPIIIEYDDTWEGLTKNLVCRCSKSGYADEEYRSILNVGNTAIVAHEVMQAGKHLYLGIEGYSTDGTLVIPTTWAMCGVIQRGANTGDDLSADPTLPVWGQLQAQIGRIEGGSIPPEQLDEIRACAGAAAQAEENAAAASRLAAEHADTARTIAEAAQIYMENSRTSAASAANMASDVFRYQTAAEAAAERAEAAASSVHNATTDPTLTKSGQAADAKVVGDELASLHKIVEMLQAGMVVVYGNVIVSDSAISVEKGVAATFAVTLDAIPTIKQIVHISTSNENVSVTPETVTFTANNYSTPQTITVTVAEGSEIHDSAMTITLTSASKTVDILVTIMDNDLDVEWHTITADEITGINADRRLIATYTGTAENILIPATLDGKPVVMNTAPNAPFDTNGVIKNIRIENGVGGTFQANPSEGVYGLGNIQQFTAGAAVKRIVIDSDNPDCTAFNCSGATALEEVHGLQHLTALTNGSMMFKRTAIRKLDAYPPQLSNAKLMFWKCFNLETVPDISMELSDCNNMFLECTKLSEVTVSAMKGCDITMIGGSSPNGGNFTFRCNYGSSLYESFRGMICHSMNSKENLFIELLDNYPVGDIVMWGDSMTKAGNTTMGNMPDQLAEMVTDDVMVWNYGYSGNTIQACAARFNNHPEKWGDTTVIWLGTNNTAMSGGDMTALIQSEFISKLTTTNYVVVGLLTTNYSDEKNAAFASAFGDHFLDIRGYFLEHMWEISGLTATEQDETDISNGLIPTSFRVDVTHLNPAGGRIVATAIREKLLAMGIITDAQTVAE